MPEVRRTPSRIASQTRVAAEEKRIEQGVKSGGITKAEAKTLNADLAAVKKQLADSRNADTFVAANVSKLSKRVTDLGSNAEKREVSFKPEKRLAWIEQGLAGPGKSPTKAQLTEMKAAVAAVEKQIRAARSDGELTSSELDTLMDRLKQTERTIDSLRGEQVVSDTAQLGRKINVLDARIREGMSLGKVDAAGGAALLKELTSIQDARRAAESDDEMTFGEYRGLDDRLDKLWSKTNKKVGRPSLAESNGYSDGPGM